MRHFRWSFVVVLAACSPHWIEADPGEAPELRPARADGAVLPARVDAEGVFVLNGLRTMVYAAEEERRLLTVPEADALVPRLHDAGINAIILYYQDMQSDEVYARLEAGNIWVAQHLGTVKRELVGFPQTGGVIGGLPDDAWIATNLEQITLAVARLARFRNILFWWMGGEFVEPVFHSAEGSAAVRASVARYRDAVRLVDPLERPFTVSHHYAEAMESVVASYIDYSDVTDFTWFTVATHFHLGDFLPGAPWWPVGQVSEPAPVLTSVLARAVALNGGRPVFLGGVYAQAPLLGACREEDQEQLLLDKWQVFSTVPMNGVSFYHLDDWNDNAIPHALFRRSEDGWIPTGAARAVRRVARPDP